MAGSQPNAQRFYKQNTISADGSRVFFSDGGTGQLYAREDPVVASARTVQRLGVAEDQRRGAGGGDPDGPQPATFMAATPDGSQVFFTSPEELTNEANTGPAAGDRPREPRRLGCTAGLHPGERERGSRSTPNTSTGRTPRKTRSAARGSTAAKSTRASSPARATRSTSRSTANTCTGPTRPKGSEKEGSIGRAKIGPTGAEQVEEDFITKASDPQGIAVNSEYIYWANVPAESPASARSRVPKIDGEDVELKGFVTKTETPGGVAVSSEYIYWTVPAANEIGRAPLAGGKGTPGFITGASDPQGIVVDSEYVYWTNAAREKERKGRSAARRSQAAHGEAPLVTGLTDPQGVALDGAQLYWASGGGDEGNDLYRYEFTSGAGAALSDLTPTRANQTAPT